jgi:putative serine protease PepD
MASTEREAQMSSHEKTHHSKWRRTAVRPAIAAVTVAAAILLAACSGASGMPASSTSTAATSPTSPANSLQQQYVDTIGAIGPSVVQVQTPAGLGSGIVLDSKGNVVTNDHVVASYKRFQVTDSTGKRYGATLVGTFAPDDLAVVHVEGSHLPPATLGDSSKLQVGDIVLAVGNPLGLQSSVTNGIISALGRTISESSAVTLPDLIQTSAQINPGNSGGALVDLSGQVIGIPTLAAIDPENQQQAGGIGFAIPSNTVKSIAGQLISHGRVVRSNRAYLGVRLATLRSGGGVLAIGVTANGPAAAAGLVAGDTITTIEGRPVQSIEDISATLASLKPGEEVALGIRTPRGTKATVTVTLGQYPGS